MPSSLMWDNPVSDWSHALAAAFNWVYGDWNGGPGLEMSSVSLVTKDGYNAIECMPPAHETVEAARFVVMSSPVGQIIPATYLLNSPGFNASRIKNQYIQPLYHTAEGWETWFLVNWCTLKGAIINTCTDGVVSGDISKIVQLPEACGFNAVWCATVEAPNFSGMTYEQMNLSVQKSPEASGPEMWACRWASADQPATSDNAPYVNVGGVSQLQKAIEDIAGLHGEVSLNNGAVGWSLTGNIRTED